MYYSIRRVAALQDAEALRRRLAEKEEELNLLAVEDGFSRQIVEGFETEAARARCARRELRGRVTEWSTLKWLLF